MAVNICESPDLQAQAELDKDGCPLTIATANLMMHAEARADSARILHEMATHMSPAKWSAESWNEWWHLLDKRRDDDGDYFARIRSALYVDFFQTVVRNCEDVAIVLDALDPDKPTDQMRRGLYSQANVSTFDRARKKDFTWYRRLLRLPWADDLPVDEQRVLDRIIYSECTALQAIVQDMHEFLDTHRAWLAYNTLKHGGQVAPGFVGPDQFGADADDVAPVMMAMYNWKRPVEDAIPIAFSRKAVLRYERLLNNARLAKHLILDQFRRTVPVGRESTIPTNSFQTCSGLADPDAPAHARLHARYSPSAIAVKVELKPPTWETAAFRTWLHSEPNPPVATDEQAQRFRDASRPQEAVP